jgi:hypothetical protein
VSSETAQLDAQRADRRPNAWIAQDLHFLGPFTSVGTVYINIEPRVTTELGDTRWQRTQRREQRVDCDVLRQWRTFGGLPVKVAMVPHRGTVRPERNANLARQVEQERPQRFPVMDVLMRVQVRRVSPHQFPKVCQLTRDFVGHADGILDPNDFVASDPDSLDKRPFAEIDVEPDTQVRVCSGIRCCRASRHPSHHKTRACDDAVAVGGDDSAVDAWALAEIVCVDDQIRRGWHGWVSRTT